MTRLLTYRAFLAAMSPSESPREALERGYYVDPPGGGVCDALTTKLELEPASTHLVLGGIGSGKTSELLRARGRLREVFEKTGDIVAYSDVSRYHDLTATPQSGVLFALTSLLAISQAKRSEAGLPKDKESVEAIDSLKKFAHGHVEWRYPEPDDDDDYDDDGRLEPEDRPEAVFHSGVLRAPPAKPINYRLASALEHLRQLLRHNPGEGRSATVLFDSLDRLPQPSVFQILVQDDIRALKRAGVGVVVVGPVRFIVGADRALTDLFDHVHFQLATDPETDAGMTFLCDVLRRRAADSPLLSEPSLPALARASGGVLRDLIALAKRSAEEAYAVGHPTITPQDVATASETFGRSLAIGLDDDQVTILKAIAESGAFVVRGERELSLLETRRVLLYPNNRWAVHPTLRDLIEGIPETA